ncbi:uncharacterized protein cno isoform X2 [Venturia canescens]|nr:uncharacterized protein LOC122411179 isoform X2 [Venturia canescens]
MATETANKKAEREALRGVIQQWNANRLDLFELSEPNEDLEFHGVMRFYFQDSGQKVATKCIRVASDATSQAVIETLIEKFRPDMRMLSVPEYALYEIHENGEERKLGLEEKPLLVQLNWHIDDREGRFLLRRIDDKTNAQGVGFAEGTSFRRKLSKREKKQMKKQEKLSRLKSAGETEDTTLTLDQNGVAEKLYTELPETSFTRSISNPEAVMRRRRQQKLERKLQQFRSKDGGPDTGGTLKIYGEALCKDVPYKTLLLSVRDSAAQVVREMLAKYGLDKVDPQQYCLVQVNGENVSSNAHQEYILDDDECPLAILMNHPSTRGSIMFHVRRRPADYVPRKRKKKPAGKWGEYDHRYEDERLPFLLELNPDGTDIPNGTGVRHRLQPNVTEVGSERPIGPQAVQAQTLTLSGSTVMPRHCVIAFTENIVTLTPCSRDAHTYVNNQRITQTTILQNGAIIKFGRMHTFRFIDPAPEDRMRQRHDSNRQMDYTYDRRSPDANSQEVSSEKYRSGSGTPNGGNSSNPPSPTKSSAASPRTSSHNAQAPEGTHNYETTFDLDGNVETASLTSSRDGNRLSQYERQQQQQQQQQQQPRGTDPILPAVLEFLEETEEAFLHAVITDVEPSAPQFKLSPTYTLYLAARYRASTHYRPELQPTERAHRLTVMLAKVATMIQRVIQERYMDASSLALWLANGSELLHMLKSDRHVGAFSTRAQDILADAVHTAFASLVRCISLELAPAMSQFMADADEPAKEAGVLQIFSNTMALLRRCRVNAALTIQLFSHLFHAINSTAFNALVSNGNLCVRWFGRRLKARLNALETWAERQGLEFASQCHLATIMQATHLLQAPKYNAEELATLSSTCFKLNSLQVRALLQKYQPAADEPRLPAELIENVVRVAESVADTLARADGREIRLEEETTLALALLLPEDGYSCEVIRGVPPGLAEFLMPLQRDGLCRMAPQPTSSGYWTIYMIDHHNNLRSPSAMSNRSGGYSGHVGQNHGGQPEIQIIKLHKSTNGMGLSIVAAKGAGQDRLGIYIKSVVAGGAADADGRLTAGDQLLKVDGQSLVGITQEKAAEYLVRTGPIVTLEVAKQGAIYHGLATLLSQPSPVMTRAAHKARPKSEQLEPPRHMEMPPQPSTSHSMGNLLTMPRQQNHVYQERLVDWNVDRVPIPGATVTQVEKAKTQYFNNYEFANNAYQSQSIGHHHHHHQDANSTGQMKLLSSRPPILNNTYLTMYPIDESPRDEDYTRSCNHRTNNKRPIPIIQEPNQMFLTIPSQIERYPPYPVRNNEQHCQMLDETTCDPQFGYYSKDKTELTFPALNRSRDSLNSYECADTTRDTFSFESEPSIPFIDQLDESYQVSSRSEENILSSSWSADNRNSARKFAYESNRDSNNLHINLMKCHHASRGCPQLTNPRPSSALQQRTREIDERTIRTNSLDRNIGEIRLTTARSSLGDIDVSATSGNVIVTHCCCHGHLTHCQAHETIEVETDRKNSPTTETNVTEPEDDSNESSESVDSRIEPSSEEKEELNSTKMRDIMPELNLDLSGLNSDVSSDDSNVREKCWRSPDEVRLGCGRVAALAKHFSKLGEAGLIKFKSIKLSASRQFVSEPDIASPRSPEISGHKRSNRKEYKSEGDLSKADKSIATTPEKEWSMILLDIQTKNELDMRVLYEKTDGLDESKVQCEEGVDDAPGELKKSSSKLSLAEQQEIIQQLKEFANLDNADAPLFIPEHEEPISEVVHYSKASSSAKETMTESIESLNDQHGDATRAPRCSKIVGKMTLEHFRKHSLPTILSTFDVTPSLECCSKKVNKLEKYWSLKDLMANDEDARTETPNDTEQSPKYFIFPTSSRVVSAPEITNETINIFHTRSLNSSGNLTIRSTISISDEHLEKPVSSAPAENSNDSKKLERASSPIIFRDSSAQGLKKEPPKTKFPGSFIRTRKLSKSQDALGEKKTSVSLTEFTGKPVARSLEKISLPKSDTIISNMNKLHECENSMSRNDCPLTAGTSGACRMRERSSKQNSNYYNTIPIKSSAKMGKPVRKKSLIVRKRSKSDMDVSERKPTPRFERGDWIFRDFPPLEIDAESRPRRMSERDLPSRLGHEPTPQQIHSSKSVPALHNVGTEGKQQHEVFNPGYSRASSSNSVTPPVQPPPMPAMNGATSLRSRSSHNLHDPMRVGTLPPSGLVSRQQSSPNLTPSQMHPNMPTNMQSNEAERFYQNLSVYRNQDPTMKQQPSPPNPGDDRSPLHTQKSLRGSQNSLNRPTPELNQARDRPISAYIPQAQQPTGYPSNQMQHQGPPPRSQSSRDIIRQEAKLQEMQEEVRRRELRGSGPSALNQYRPNNYSARAITAAQTANAMRPSRPIGSTPNLGPNSPTYSTRPMGPNYGYAEQYQQYGQFGNKHSQATNHYGLIPKSKNEPVRAHPMENARSPGDYDPNRQVMEHNRQFGSGSLNGPQYSNGPGDVRNGQQPNENLHGRTQNGDGSLMMNADSIAPSRPMLSEDAYRESPPPPPLNTSTHPLYSKPTADSTRYTASMQDPPRGGYYPAQGATQQQQQQQQTQARQYQYSATNPWQREEREKEQARRREAARLWRDQQIAELSSLPQRTSQQEEQLRALQLERDFQKRAEEAANQQDDDDESNDLDNESAQRVQGLLRMAANQDRNNQLNQQQQQQHTLMRTNANNQSIRGTLSPQPVGSQLQSTSIPLHTATSQQGSAHGSGNSYTGQNDGTNLHNQQTSNQNTSGQQPPMSPTYGSTMGQQFINNAKGSTTSSQQMNEERERQRRIDELKKIQAEFDESQRKREDEIRQQQQQLQLHQQQMQQLYAQQQQHQQQQQMQSNLKSQQQLHPGMLRLDNLVINGPSSPPSSQNGSNDAPPPPERGSSYAVMSQQSALRSNTSTTSNVPLGSHPTATIKRVSFHDPNANIEPPRNVSSVTSSTPSSITMDTIREDPNNFINDAENLLASPNTPEGPGGQFQGATPGVIGAQEVYKDPRQKRLAEKQKQQQNSQLGEVPEKLSFKEKMKMFAMETGEDGTPRDKVKISRAQRDIDNIGSPLSPNNNNRS